VNVVEIFRNDMMRAAEAGLFACEVHLNESYGEKAAFF
jgi:hypothetical protein